MKEIVFMANKEKEAEPFDWDAIWILPGWRVTRVGTLKVLPNGAPAIELWTFQEDSTASGYTANDLLRMVKEKEGYELET